MGRTRQRAPAVVVLLLVLAGALALCATTGAATSPRPGSLDASFGAGGRVLVQSIPETAPAEFGAVARETNGDTILELRRRTLNEEPSREIELRAPDGSLIPSFGSGGRLSVEEGQGLLLLPDGDILLGVEGCGGKESSAMLLGPDGARMTSFGAAGCGAAPGFAEELLTTDPQGRIVVAGTPQVCPCGKDTPPSFELVVARLLPDGSLDPGFGKNGVVHTHADDGLEAGGNSETLEARSLGSAPDGGVLIATESGLIRLDPTGALDKGFGNSGAANVPGGVEALLVEPGGSIVATTSGAGKPPSVSRFGADGKLDPSFGNEGTTPLPLPIGTGLTKLVAAPGGGVVIGGKAPFARGLDSSFGAFVERLTSSGVPDPGYGNAGLVELAEPAPLIPDASKGGLAVGADGSALLAGTNGDDAVANALTPSGAPDEPFADAGALTEHFTEPAQLEATGVALAPGGGLTLMSGSFDLPGIHGGYLTGFGPSGAQIPRPGGAPVSPTRLKGRIVPVRPGGVIVWDEDSRKTGGVLHSAGQAGQPLAGFGKRGLLQLPASFRAWAVVPAPGGGAAVIGSAGKNAMAVYRVGPKGQPLRRFGRNGLAVLAFGHLSASATSGAIEPDGDIVLAGWVGSGVAAARLLPNGRPDPSFGRRGAVYKTLPDGAYGSLVAPWHGGIVIATADNFDVRGPTTGLIRLDRHGRPARRFGHRGFVPDGLEDPPLALFTGGGKIVLLTHPGTESGTCCRAGVELRSFRPDGSLDRSFWHGGIRLWGRGTDEEHTFVPAVAVQQPDGRIVVAGTAREGRGHARAELVRFLLR